MNKYQKHNGYSYGYTLVCVDKIFSNTFKSYLGEDAVYNFINSMVEESKYCTDVMNKYFKEKLVMTKKDNQHFKNSTKRWIYDNDFVDGDVKARDHCHVTGKFRVSQHRDCNVKVEST